MPKFLFISNMRTTLKRLWLQQNAIEDVRGNQCNDRCQHAGCLTVWGFVGVADAAGGDAATSAGRVSTGCESTQVTAAGGEGRHLHVCCVLVGCSQPTVCTLR